MSHINWQNRVAHQSSDHTSWTRLDAVCPTSADSPPTAATAIVSAAEFGHYGSMVKACRALVILPGSAQDSGSYIGACEALGLRPSLRGYAIFLAETSAGSLALVSAELGEPHGIQHAATARADRTGPRNTGQQHREGKQYGEGKQHGETAVVRGNRVSTGADEVIEIGLGDKRIAQVVVREPSGTRGVTAETHPVAKPVREAKAERKANAEGRVEAAAGEAVGELLAEAFVGAVWPASPSTGTLKDYESLYKAAEFLLEPETLLLKVINASARAAAHAAGLGLLAPLVGQLAEDLCAPLLRPSPERCAAAGMVKIVDIELYLEGGRPLDCPALRELTVATVADEIGSALEFRSDPHTNAPPPPPRRGVRRAPAEARAAALGAPATARIPPPPRRGVRRAPAEAGEAALAARAAARTPPNLTSAGGVGRCSTTESVKSRLPRLTACSKPYSALP
jgi:hypothetical protein